MSNCRYCHRLNHPYSYGEELKKLIARKDVTVAVRILEAGSANPGGRSWRIAALSPRLTCGGTKFSSAASQWVCTYRFSTTAANYREMSWKRRYSGTQRERAREREREKERERERGREREREREKGEAGFWYLPDGKWYCFCARNAR